MTENEVLFQISNLVNGRLSFAQAVEQVGNLLAREMNGKGLSIDGAGASIDAIKLLDSFDQPYRSFYNVPLRDRGQILGEATLCFASDHFQGAMLQRLADFVGEQLSMLLARTRLAERKVQWKREIEKVKEDLAARKVFQRAEGILVAQRGMTAVAARRWIGQQSEKSGLTKEGVADRIIAYHQATGLLEQRIA
jgi:ANTAR domain-containing protein